MEGWLTKRPVCIEGYELERGLPEESVRSDERSENTADNE
jgi:hypothetical protein